MNLPVEGRITQTFNTPVNYIAGRTKHEAIDIVTNGSQPITMIADCKVIKVINKYGYSPNSGFGNELWVQYENGTNDRFCHCAKDSIVPIGTKLTQGQRGASTGQTGYRKPITTFHTHWERYINGKRVDPLDPKTQPNQLTQQEMKQLEDHEKAISALFKRVDALEEENKKQAELITRLQDKKLGKQGVKKVLKDNQ